MGKALRLLLEAMLRQDRDVVESGGSSGGGGGVTQQLVLKTKRFYYSKHVKNLKNRQQMDTDDKASNHRYQNHNQHTREESAFFGDDYQKQPCIGRSTIARVHNLYLGGAERR